MQTLTYVGQSFGKKGRLCRWPDHAMPLKVFISKFNWYKSSGTGDEYKYTQMIIDGFNLWESSTNGAVAFERTLDIYQSNICISWKRVERKALGNCTYTQNDNGLAVADIEIGLSDGLIHQKQTEDGEVFHTILHEIGHSVGLGHSPYKGDIMYVPHEYGVSTLSNNDIETLKWLYKFPCNKQETEILSMNAKYGARNVDELIYKMRPEYKSEFAKTKEALENEQTLNKKDLLQENENIGDLKKYLMQLNNIKINYKK